MPNTTPSFGKAPLAGGAPAHPIEGIAGAARRRARWLGALGLIWVSLCGMAPAAELTLPEGARVSFSETADPDGYALPVAPWDGRLPVRRVEGRVDRVAYRLPGGDATILQTLKPLRSQLEVQGYSILFECADRECGGFDFRFATEVLPAPHMYVDMGDFHFLAAQDAASGRSLTLLVSRTGADRYVQMIAVSPSMGGGSRLSSSSRVVEPEAAAVAPPAPRGDFATELEARGHLVLEDLAFASGATALGPGPYDSLADLAAYLRGDRARRVILVGHTDAVGSLDSNLGLSRRRAAAARERLIAEHGVAAEQVAAEGMGYLAPRASNLTDAGRIENRRVEVVLLP